MVRCFVAQKAPDLESATYIVRYGVDLEVAQSARQGLSTGAFWATKQRTIGKTYALAQETGPPALVTFDLPQDVMNELLGRNPIVVREHTMIESYEFLPGSIKRINSAMTNVQIVELEIDLY